MSTQSPPPAAAPAAAPAPPSPAQQPPLLLTKPLTIHLSSLLSSHISTVLLTSSSGKLLAHVASPPRSTADLRTLATVAGSLVGMYGGVEEGGLPIVTDEEDDVDVSGGEGGHGDARSYDGGSFDGRSDGGYHVGREDTPIEEPSTRYNVVLLTIQLTHGTLILRRLSSGLILAVLGASGTPGSRPTSSHHRHGHGQHLGVPGAQPALLSSLSGVPAASAVPGHGEEAVSVGGCTVASSVNVVQVGMAQVMSMRKEVEEFAVRLDGLLSTLAVPEEGVFE